MSEHTSTMHVHVSICNLRIYTSDILKFSSYIPLGCLAHHLGCMHLALGTTRTESWFVLYNFSEIKRSDGYQRQS